MSRLHNQTWILASDPVLAMRTSDSLISILSDSSFGLYALGFRCLALEIFLCICNPPRHYLPRNDFYSIENQICELTQWSLISLHLFFIFVLFLWRKSNLVTLLLEILQELSVVFTIKYKLLRMELKCISARPGGSHL